MQVKDRNSCLIVTLIIVFAHLFGFFIGKAIATPNKIRYENAIVESREYIGDRWNVTFRALDGNTYVVEDYATNLGATIYKLKFATNDTKEYFDDVIIEITQVTDLTK